MKARHYFSSICVLAAIALAVASHFKAAGISLLASTAIELIAAALFDKQKNT